jgi:hypothetical protein
MSNYFTMPRRDRPHVIEFPGTGLNPRPLNDFDRRCIDLYFASPDRRAQLEREISRAHDGSDYSSDAVDNAWSAARNLVRNWRIVPV